MTTTPPPLPADAERLENALELKEVEGLSQGQIVRARFFRHKGAMVGLAVLIGIVVLAFSSVGVGAVSGWWHFNGNETGAIVNARGAPTLSMSTWLGGDGFTLGEHPLGQDEIGRDMFAQVMRGTQTSLMVVAVIGVVAALLGVIIGSAAGFYRGRVDTVLMRTTDLFITVPVLVTGAVIGRLSGGIGGFAFAATMGLVLWTGLARLVRGEFLGLREREFIDAARVAGASDLRIIFKHILPNAIGVVIVSTTLLMSSAILLETALSYLGVGIVRPDISLGMLISQYQASFSTRPWLFWWPALFIVAIALCINFIGDGLRDAFDPRQKRIPSASKMDRQMTVQRRAAEAAVGGGAGAGGVPGSAFDDPRDPAR